MIVNSFSFYLHNQIKKDLVKDLLSAKRNLGLRKRNSKVSTRFKKSLKNRQAGL